MLRPAALMPARAPARRRCRRSRASSPGPAHRHQAAARGAGRERQGAEAEHVGDAGVAQREQVLVGEMIGVGEQALDVRAAGSAVVGSSTASKPAAAAVQAARMRVELPPGGDVVGGGEAGAAPEAVADRRRTSAPGRASISLAPDAVGLAGEEAGREREHRSSAGKVSGLDARAGGGETVDRGVEGGLRARRGSAEDRGRRGRRACGPRGARPRGRAPGAPERAASTSAASSTERQSGPTVSKRGQSGTTPSSGSRPWVVFSPTRSFQAAGHPHRAAGVGADRRRRRGRRRPRRRRRRRSRRGRARGR